MFLKNKKILSPHFYMFHVKHLMWINPINDIIAFIDIDTDM